MILGGCFLGWGFCVGFVFLGVVFGCVFVFLFGVFIWLKTVFHQ